MWSVKGKVVDAQRFAPFEPSRVLNYHDGPKIFTFLDADEALCLACWSDEDDMASRFLVVPVTEQTIAELENGMLSVREALTQARLWVVDVSHESGLLDAWLVKPQDVPNDAQPQPRTMLHRSLEPILSLRATGPAIRPGEIPGSVIKGTVEGAQKAIKILAEYEMNSPARKGRPSRTLQKLYDLPVQKTLAASFEVQFRSPLGEPGLFDGLDESEKADETKTLQRVGEHLKKGLAWLTSQAGQTSALPVPNDPDLSETILKALKFLTPSPRGPIQGLEIGGEMATHSTQPIRVTKKAREIVNGAASRLPVKKEKRVELRGRVRELNAAALSFELQLSGQAADTIRVCKMDADFWDDVHDVLGTDEQIDVLGMQTDATGVVRVLDIMRPDAD